MTTDTAALSRYLDRATWLALAPGMHVEDGAFVNAAAPFQFDAASVETARALLRSEGYLQIPPPDWRLPIEAMAAVIAGLDRRGIPVAFAFVYDEFWCLFGRLVGLLDAVLGPGFQRLPDFWAWCVDPRRDDSGWKPHRDKDWQTLFPDGSPKSATIWIPLSDATPLNGCMYIVPADRDRAYGKPGDERGQFEYADIRALPAAAGTIFCWNQAVLHWGAHASPRETAPRIAVAFEFQSGAVAPYNQPLTSPYTIPTLRLRLQLIAMQILQYDHMYPLSPEVAALARTLAALPPAGATPAG